jgi:nucleotide-binding universal stress UspA family protein
LKWDSEWQITYETFRDMGIAYAVGLVLIYLLVVAQFRSYVTPLIIMAPIPLTIIGVLPGHALLGNQFTATSIIGMIALAGIIVRCARPWRRSPSSLIYRKRRIQTCVNNAQVMRVRARSGHRSIQETDMYRRILVAADGSAAADLALEHAFALAKDQRARVRIVHALESLHYLVGLAGAYPFDAPGLLESMRREGQRVLAASLEKARAVAVDAETALLDGQPTDRIAQIVVQDARNWDADLIVLGTHGRHGFDRVFLGSVAETVLRIASVPVLLVRAK